MTIKEKLDRMKKLADAMVNLEAAKAEVAKYQGRKRGLFGKL